MLDQFDLNSKISPEEFTSGFEQQKVELMLLQQQIRSAKIPVIILFEGWGASGKGSMISNLIMSLDPRGFKVHAIGPVTPEEQRYPMLHRFWRILPEYGQVAILDRSWYREVSTARLEDKRARKRVEERFAEIGNFERQLTDDGYLVIKFFLQISKKEQKKRFEALEDKKATRWRVTEDDWRHNQFYDEYYRAFDEMVERTDYGFAPWRVIPAHDRRYAVSRVYAHVIEALQQALAAKQAGPLPAPTAPRESSDVEVEPIPSLGEYDLSKALDKEDYRRALRKGQKRLFELHNKLYRKRVPLILCFEGWDAAGKGGAIKRITRALDPRGYEVIPVAAPTPVEKNHQYLWRFWNALPKDGHIAIFDRSWYGRVMVERVEGFCTEEQWMRAYDEINHFERDLAEWGAIVLKFWLHIDKDEQLNRFNDRQYTPAKQWKITGEDWRNREKWDEYLTCVNEMLQRTNTDCAPWVVVEANDKNYARVKVISQVIEAIEARL